MPAEYPLFPSRAQMLAYIHDYAAARDLARDVTLSTAVQRIEPERSAWRVTTGDGETRRYAAVVVANGHLHEPAQPSLPGFTGRQLHSATYRSPDDVAGSRVLVVGSGNSGCDIAVDCAQRVALRTTISIRTGHLFQPKTFAGKPRGELWVMRLPPRLQDRALRLLIRSAVGRPQDYGLPRPATWSLADQKPVVNTQLLHWIHHGRIAVAPGIAGADGLAVEFADGRREEFDTIVWCTGYDVVIPFLDHALLPWQRRRAAADGGCVLPKRGPGRLVLRRPGGAARAAAAGLLTAGGAGGRMIRVQERLADPLAETFTSHGAAEHRIDIIRSVWQAQIAQAESVIGRLEAGERAT